MSRIRRKKEIERIITYYNQHTLLQCLESKRKVKFLADVRHEVIVNHRN